MQLNTAGKGLAAVFKPWKIPIIKELQSRPNMNSGQAYKFLQQRSRDLEDPELKRSRASVIFFLNDLVDEGIVEYTEKSGKGGYHRVYKMALTPEQLAHKCIAMFVAKLLEAFPEGSKTFMWPRP